MSEESGNGGVVSFPFLLLIALSIKTMMVVKNIIASQSADNANVMGGEVCETEEEFNKDDSVNHPMTTIGFHMFFYSWFLLDIGGVWSSDIAHLCYVLGYLMALFGSMTLVVGILVDKAGKVIKEVKNTRSLS